jgi:hypothetical protein
VGADPIVQQLLDPPAPAGPSQQGEKHGNTGRHTERGRAYSFKAQERGQQPPEQPSAEGEQHD